jgi:predicted Zn finger-like uncharacterized protein
VNSFTRCPRCSVWYRIDAATLERAAGLVRCGRCGEVFDARATLWTAAPAVTDPPPPASTTETVPEETSRAHTRIDAPSETVETEGLDGPPLGRLEDLDLEETMTVRRSLAPKDDSFTVVEDPFTIPKTSPLAPPPPPPPARRGRRTLWSFANATLLLLILASLVYLQPWAERSSRGRAPARGRAATALAVHSRPESFRITAAEVIPSRRHPKTALVVAGTILNTAARAGALPWLLVRLTDVTGRTVASGIFPPARYTPAASKTLHARTAIPFRLRVLAPAHAVAGFRIDLCRGRPPRLYCT